MAPRPPGTPRPTERHVRLLDEAIAILEGVRGDARAPGLRRALGTIDQLGDAVRTFDSNAFPDGFTDRLTGARLDLNLGDPEGALAALRGLRQDLAGRTGPNERHR